MTSCPGSLGRGGEQCNGCLLRVDVNTTIVAHTERQSEFKFESGVVLSTCSIK